MFFALMMFLTSFSVFAQSPVNQGDFLVGTTELSGVSISDVSFTPSAGYALTDQIVVGVQALEGTEDVWQAALFGRYYLNSPFYGQVNVNYNSETEDAAFGISGGVTGFITEWFYFEPNVGVNFSDNSYFRLSLNFGIRF